MAVHAPFVTDISDYLKVKHVGQGTYGEVWSARQGSNTVALKRIICPDVADLAKRTGFPVTALREIGILKRLSHRNIAHLLDVAVDPTDRNGVYMVMEFCPYDLSGLVRQRVKFGLSHIKCLALQMFTGMAYLHASGFLHRDIKAANMLVGSDGVLKITDYGLARVVDQLESNPLTPNVCTPWYRPPEIFLGLTAYNDRVDVWGLGCIVAELVEGRPILAGQWDGGSQCALDQYLLICQLCGTPTPKTWPKLTAMPASDLFSVTQSYPRSVVHRFKTGVDAACLIEHADGRGKLLLDFLDKLLVMDPVQRLSAEDALLHPVFWTTPRPCQPSELPLPADYCHEMNAAAPSSISRPAPSKTAPVAAAKELFSSLPRPSFSSPRASARRTDTITDTSRPVDRAHTEEQPPSKRPRMDRSSRP